MKALFVIHALGAMWCMYSGNDVIPEVSVFGTKDEDEEE